jgi:hypothetical protein
MFRQDATARSLPFLPKMMKRPPIEDVSLQIALCITFYKKRISNAEKTYLNWANSWLWSKEGILGHHIGILERQRVQFCEAYMLVMTLELQAKSAMLLESALGTPTELQMLSAANNLTEVQQALGEVELEFFNCTETDEARESLKAKVAKLEIEQVEKLETHKKAVIAHTEFISVPAANYEPVTMWSRIASAFWPNGDSTLLMTKSE